MRQLWIPIACLGFSLLAGAEVGDHSGAAGLKGRTQSSSAARKLEDAVNACSNGRASSRGLAVQPSTQISSPPIYRFTPIAPPMTPVEPPKNQGPFVRENPRDQKEFPGEAKYKECLKAIPVVDFFTCPAVLTTCKAETVDKGKTKVRPLVVDGGDPCTTHDAFTKAACGRGLKFERFKENDIVCGPTQSEVN